MPEGLNVAACLATPRDVTVGVSFSCQRQKNACCDITDVPGGTASFNICTYREQVSSISHSSKFTLQSVPMTTFAAGLFFCLFFLTCVPLPNFSLFRCIPICVMCMCVCFFASSCCRVCVCVFSIHVPPVNVRAFVGGGKVLQVCYVIRE